MNDRCRHRPEAYRDIYADIAFRYLRRLGGRSRSRLRQPMQTTRSGLRRVVFLRSNHGPARDIALGAVTSSSGEEA